MTQASGLRALTVLRRARKRRTGELAASRLAALLARKTLLDVVIVGAMPMVNRNATSIAAQMPGRVDRSDLVDVGYLALVKAAQKFDASLGWTLAAYARRAVRGAMWDAVRRRNWTEMSHLELKPELVEDVSDRRQGPEEMLRQSRNRKAAAQALTCLSERERTIVGLYYGEQDTLQTIGSSLGLTRTSVCRIHRRAIGKMQEYFLLRGIKSA